MSTLPGSTQETSALNDGESTNPSTNTHIQDIIDTRLSRRGVLKGGIAASTTALFSSIGLSACGGSSNNKDDAPDAQLRRRRQEQERRGHRPRRLPAQHPPRPRRPPHAPPTPPGPTTAARAPSPTTGVLATATTACTTSACPTAGAYSASRSDRGVLCVNHEYVVGPNALHTAGRTAGAARLASEVEKEIYAHGVSVCEVKRDASGAAMSLVRGSTFNRRVTSATPMAFSGPARGNALLQTQYSPDGTTTRGTDNNCGNGVHPLGHLPDL
jgi:secreted PhoX family phosphatase